MTDNNEVEMTIVRDLRTATKALYSATNAITKYLGVQVEPAPAKATSTDEPKSEQPKSDTSKQLTLEQVRKVLADKSRSGHTDAIRGFLEKHGASKLSDIDPQEYVALVEEVETLRNE
jgi:hypothetical protein